MMASIRCSFLYMLVAISFMTAVVYGSILYEGGTVLAFDEQTERINVLKNASVLIEGNTITQIAITSNSSSTPPNTTRIDATGKIISPGFIDV
jgi:imidazolonepropionase-like amidohydrolase